MLYVANRGVDSLQQRMPVGEAAAFVFRLGESEEPLGLGQSAGSGAQRQSRGWSDGSVSRESGGKRSLCVFLRSCWAPLFPLL